MSENQQPNTDTMGKTMMIVAWIIAIALATWFFGAAEKKQYNPNYSPDSSRGYDQIKVELLRNKYGHYVTTGIVDGKEVVFMLDTGATDVAIPGSLEQYLHLERGQQFYANTANGRAKVYATKIDYLQIGEIVLKDIQASIIPAMQGKEILLGMSALKQLEFRQKGNRLTLIQELP